MARLYADEQVPRQVSELLRAMGHDVLTVQAAGNANLDIPDEAVLVFAISDNRAVLTLKCHTCISEAITVQEPLAGKLIRVVRPAS